jgi:hypothetical protein
MRPINATPERIVQQALINGSVGAIWSAPVTTNWRVFTFQENPEGDQAIFVHGPAGILDGRNQRTGESVEHFGIQVKIRGKDPEVAKLKALEVQKFCTETLKMTDVAVSGHVYKIHAMTSTSGVIPLGQEEQNRRFWFSTNFTATITQES